jgi:flagellar FliL protein
MADTNELDLDGGDSSELDSSKSKKPSGLAALLPNLLKFVAIGLGALIFIITVSVITYNILNTRGQSQTVMPSNSPFQGARPQYSFYTNIGSIRTATKDPVPYAVVVDMVLGYTENDNAAMTEMNARLYELRDFVRSFFRTKMASELQPENEARLKQEIIEHLNQRVFNNARVRIITFNQLDIMEM